MLTRENIDPVLEYMDWSAYTKQWHIQRTSDPTQREHDRDRPLVDLFYPSRRKPKKKVKGNSERKKRDEEKEEEWDEDDEEEDNLNPFKGPGSYLIDEMQIYTGMCIISIS